jgi:60 kDa SS-A/Ro ribonucleoprotein
MQVSSYLRQHGTRTPTPQSEPMRADQVVNNQGGYGWAVDNWTRLARWLVLGSEGGSFHVGEYDLTKQNVDALRECITEDGVRTVNEIVAVSEAGRAPKNDQAIFALAFAVAEGNDETKKAALDALPRVCRIGTHLFMFMDFLDGAFGKATGRAKRRALGQWYTEKSPDKLAYQMVKYRQRGGWSHRDVLRLSHPAAPTPLHAGLFDFACGRDYVFGDATDHGHTEVAPIPSEVRIVEGYVKVQKAENVDEVVRLIGEYGLPREALPTEHLNHAKVWDAMLQSGMPITAMVRNLATMTRVGVLTPQSEGTRKVLATLADAKAVSESRIHPLNVLFALKTYASGMGFRGDNVWSPIPQIVDALDGLFYTAFGNVESTGKRWLFGLDVSGSMTSSTIANSNLTPREGAAAMALVTAAVEPLYECVAFTSAGTFMGTARWGHPTGLLPVALSKRQRLDDVIRNTNGLPHGGTDCALPMLYATQMQREVDVFAIYTDNETAHGEIHPTQALQEYRRQSGIDAKLVTVGMTSGGFTIADPQDAGMLDVVGFDSATPNIISEYALGRL